MITLRIITAINTAEDQQQTIDTLIIIASNMSAVFSINRAKELVGVENESVIRFS